MAGNKQKTDGNVRKDFPGGFAGDKKNAFTGEGLTAAERDMQQWMKNVLHWRKGNKLITEGKQTQFIPYNGVYVLARRYDGRTVMTILNGTSKPATMPVARYAEVIGNATVGRDIPTGASVRLDADVQLQPRETLILEF